jgi:hypothetical protein
MCVCARARVRACMRVDPEISGSVFLRNCIYSQYRTRSQPRTPQSQNLFGLVPCFDN